MRHAEPGRPQSRLRAYGPPLLLLALACLVFFASMPLGTLFAVLLAASAVIWAVAVLQERSSRPRKPPPRRPRATQPQMAKIIPFPSRRADNP